MDTTTTTNTALRYAGTKTIAMPFGDTELAAKAREMADLDGKVRSREDEKARVMKEFKEEIDALYGELHRVALEVKEGTGRVSVDVLWEQHWDDRRKEMLCWRLDGLFVLIDQRGMNTEELRALRVEEEREWKLRNPELPFPGGEVAIADTAEPVGEDELADDDDEEVVDAIAAASIAVEPVEEKRPAPPPPKCPALIEGRPDGICGVEGSRRARGFCEEHKDLSPAERTKAIAARKMRQLAAREAMREPSIGNGHDHAEETAGAAG